MSAEELQDACSRELIQLLERVTIAQSLGPVSVLACLISEAALALAACGDADAAGDYIRACADQMEARCADRDQQPAIVARIEAFTRMCQAAEKVAKGLPP